MSVKLSTIKTCVSVMLWRKLMGVSATMGSGDMSGRRPRGSMLCLKGWAAGLLKGAAGLSPKGLATPEAEKGLVALGLAGATGTDSQAMLRCTDHVAACSCTRFGHLGQGWWLSLLH